MNVNSKEKESHPGIWSTGEYFNGYRRVMTTKRAPFHPNIGETMHFALLREPPELKCLSTNAALLPEYKPKDVPSKMVDWCLTIRPNRSDQRIIDEIRRIRPGDSINQTDCGLLRKHPIAGSIEVKRQGEQYDAAVLQIGTWHSAQWRSLRWGRNADDESLPNIKFLSGYIIYGHDWQFIPSVLDEEGVSRLVRPALQIGDTRTVPGILKLFASLQVLKEDAEEAFWPAFRADVLGISA